jgi:uncharacterized spore protein YtfJ
MIEQPQTKAEVGEAVRASPSDRLLERLAEVVGAKANVQAVFGQPVRHEGLTVIPVARVRWGFGGGGGRSDAAPSGPASGSGGGGGVAAEPIGYLEVRSEGAAFRSIREPLPSPVLLIASALSAAIVIRAIARLLGTPRR